MVRTRHALRPEPGSPLREAWDALRSEQPGIRPREAALALGVSEAELLATTCGEETVRLRAPWVPLVRDLSRLGRVVAQTRTARAILEQRGIHTEAPFGIDVRPAYDRWLVGYALRDAGAPQLAFHDRTGTAVHKVFVVEEARWDAWEALARRHAHESQSPVERLPPPEPWRPRPDAAIDASLLRTGWAALKGQDGIGALLEAHRATRLQALRVVSPKWARPIATTALVRALRGAAAEGTPITVTVENRGTAQSYCGGLPRVYASGRWLAARSLDVSLQVRADRIATAWIVRAPMFAGVTHTLEFFDALGDPVVRIAAAREGNDPDPDRWVALVRRVAGPPAG